MSVKGLICGIVYRLVGLVKYAVESAKFAANSIAFLVNLIMHETSNLPKRA